MKGIRMGNRSTLRSMFVAVIVALSFSGTVAAEDSAPASSTPIVQGDQKLRMASTGWVEGMSYTYDAAGNIIQIGTDEYQYDSVDRLVSGAVNGNVRRYEYDAFGNRTGCTDVSSGGICQPVTIVAATNRVSGATYDAAGSVTQFGADTYTYDPVGMLQGDTAAPTDREYVYTADDERIAVIVGTTWNWTLRDASGKVLREMTSTAGTGGSHTNWQWTRDNIWRNGLLLSSRQSSGGSVTTRHYHLDHLGTPRVVSNESGSIIGNHDYFPFGTELAGNLHEPGESRLKFTGHERDELAGETDPLDYMHARYYSSRWGRFLSVDPTWESADLTQPQSWNRYTYVLNNPIRLVDPTGLLPFDWSNGGKCMILCNGDEKEEEETEGRDHDDSGEGLFGSSNIVDVKKIDDVMVATLDKINDVGVNLMMMAAPIKVPGGPAVAFADDAAKSSVALVRVVTPHAAAAMAEHGVSTAMMLKTLANGKRYLDLKNLSIVFVLPKAMASGKDLAVAVGIFSRRVTTVMVNAKAARPRFIALP